MDNARPADALIKGPYGTFKVNPRRDPKMYRDLQLLRYPQLEFGVSVISSFIRPGWVVVDGGAHIGTYALQLAKKAGRVIAFEPTPETFHYLAENVFLNDAKNIEVKNKGLGAKVGHVSLAPLTDGLATSQTLNTHENGNIVLGTLDAEIPKAGVVKLDIEGMELDALRGAERLIRESHPVFILEIFPSALKKHGSSPRAIETFLYSRGYKLYLPFESGGQLLFGKAPTLALLVFLIMPGWLLKGGQSLSFDIVAIPPAYKADPSMHFSSAVRLVAHLTAQNFSDKARRVKAFLKRLMSRTSEV